MAYLGSTIKKACTGIMSGEAPIELENRDKQKWFGREVCESSGKLNTFFFFSKPFD